MPRRPTALALSIAFMLPPSSTLVEGAEVIQKEGKVEVRKLGVAPRPAVVGLALLVQDRLNTGDASRAVLKMSTGWNARIDEQTAVEITQGGLTILDRQALKLDQGRAFIYRREAKGEWKILTPAGVGTGNGTQILIQVLPNGLTFIQVIEGGLEFENSHGKVALAAGEACEADSGSAPRKTAAIETRNLLQWVLYYPAVLQPGELGLAETERQSVAASLEAYRAGDLPGALEKYPASHNPVSPAEKLYRAAVLLAAGQVDEARGLFEQVPAEQPGRRALERMIAAVLSLEQPPAGALTTASEALAESYHQQSRRHLEAAREAAQRSTELAPDSGFTWTRLAELEFSFGRIREAQRALERGIHFSPRNAQAHALRGFLLSAENRIASAQAAFEHALQLDPALGNAWLGRGLTKIRRGQLAAGRSDLQTAVTVEPTRSFLYSYHAKVVGMEDGSALAAKDLLLAKQIDEQDPTPWLYTAIQDQQDYRYNAAIAELQESIRRNDNRQVYRSQFLLDQDRAVRSTNLATIYRNNGMAELAVREATRAVESDYANGSAHLFLANSFDALRDPKQLLLRYETAWFNEQLLANLLSPVGGGPLSQFVSQQEYSKMLEADGVGGSSVTEWRDDGYFSQQASVQFTSGRVSTGVDFSYRRDNETRPNHDNLIRELTWQMKLQLSAHDVLYSLIQGRTQKNGDLLQTYGNVPGDDGRRLVERQDPGLALLGWNRRWNPGVHTLLLAGRLAAEQTLWAPGFLPRILGRDASLLQPGFLQPSPSGGLEYSDPALRNATVPPVAIAPNGALLLSADFRRAIAPFLGRGQAIDFFAPDAKSILSNRLEFEIRSGELQHLWQTRHNTLVIGGRWQAGDFDTQTRMDFLSPRLVPSSTSPAALQDVSTDFERRGLYAYDFVSLRPWLTLIAGGSWDRIKRPDNFRNPPVNDRQVTTERKNGKVGARFNASRWLTVRALYAESLGGVSFDESVRLEPVQLAGFNQAFRTVIPESLVGSVEAPVYKNAGLAVEGALPTRTWWAGSLNRISERVDRTVGTFDRYTLVLPTGAPNIPPIILPSELTQQLDYREKVLAFGINQLLGSQVAVGANYRYIRTEMRERTPGIPIGFNPRADDFNRASLEEVIFSVNWNSPTGWFAQTQGNWYSQDLHGTAGDVVKIPLRGDHFWHFSLQGGFRSQRNRREVSAGVLNLTNRGYNLSPLSYHRDLPRGKTVFFRCRIGF